MRNTIIAVFSAGALLGCTHAEGSSPQTAAGSNVCAGLSASDYQQALGTYAPGKVHEAERVYGTKRPKVNTRAGLASPRRFVAGARLYIPAERGMTPAYLERTLTCHALNTNHAAAMGVVVHPNDPLQVEGVSDVDVASSGPSFVVSVVAEERSAGEMIWRRADALQRSTQVEVKQVSSQERAATRAF